MLRIQNVRKKYVTGELVQTALDDVSLNLRDNEFIAILGPSGSGKTTLLNIIGGLDRYDSGDLIIDNISTKKYTDRDWDSYRNHTVGFVFQSYNLIPHQTVLANVELALTISGVKHSERRKRAIKALQEVGLGNQLHKKPNQMSGGQMQRVAIARALVNNPSILLADEPTGALDSETSIQVMELLKKVSKDRLVVMVTHNPELAVEYANRIVRVKDGKIIDDSNPYLVDNAGSTVSVHKNMGKASMSFRTALTLSFHNLITKKTRTLLTAFAGSIGIIGIALIVSLSSGFQRYIDKIQEDTLANYPLTIQSESADMTGAFSAMMSLGSNGDPSDDNTVSEKPMISQMFASIGANDLTAFKTHLEANMDKIGHTLNGIQYGYNVKPRIYADKETDLLQVNPASLFQKITGNSFMSAYMDMNAFQEMVDNEQLLNSQYDVLRGRWPQQYNELVFVLPTANQLPDHLAYTLGMKNMDSLDKMLDLLKEGKDIKSDAPPMEWTYDDLMALTFRLISVPDLYRFNDEYGVWEDMSEDPNFMKDLVKNGEELKIVGIACPKEFGSMTSLSAGIAYHPSLTKHVIETAASSEIVQNQLLHKDVDVFSGKPFDSKEFGGLSFKDMISIDGNAISSAFGVDISENSLIDLLENYLRDILASLEIDTADAQQAFTETLSDFSTKMLQQFVAENADANGNAVLNLADAETLTEAFLSSDYASVAMEQLSRNYSVTDQQLYQIYNPLLIGLVTNCIANEIRSEYLPDVTPESGIGSAIPETIPDATVSPAASGIAAFTETLPDVSIPVITPDRLSVILTSEKVDELVSDYLKSPIVTSTASAMAFKMMQDIIMEHFMDTVSSFDDVLTKFIGESFYVDEEKIANSFHFNMDEQELLRLMNALSLKNQERTANTNLNQLGYAAMNNPAFISLYMVDFASKEEFMTFLDDYNFSMLKAGQEEQVIHYTDMTGMMMASVRTIIDSISYVLIAFVAVSLVVSSIMIGIITYISVMERTKEIGVLRAMGASKQNIAQVFNAETFIIGLCSGLIGIGITLLLLIPGNSIIHSVTGNANISAHMPIAGIAVLIGLSMFLTLLSGLIPSMQAAKKDPVIALRSE